MIGPIRIAHVMGKMAGGGVEAFVMNYYRHVNRDLIQFDFIIDADSTIVPFEEIQEYGGRIFRIPPYQHLVEYQKGLRKLFDQQNWTIIHSHINTLSLFPLRIAKKKGIPIRIAHSHATMGRGEVKRNAMKLALRPFANVYATDRLACSNYAGEWLFGKRKSFTVIPNAIDVSLFQFNASVREDVRRTWNISPDCYVVGSVGRMVTTKNQEFLIEAFSKLQSLLPNSLLLIAGSGPLRDMLEEKANKLRVDEKVLFLGQIENVNTLYHAMDAFVLPSLYEGFGMALLEAQVAGLPCVVSDRVSSEVVLSNQCTCLPLEIGAQQWAREILRYRGSHERTCKVDKKFEMYDIKKAAERLQDYYLRLYERGQ